MQRERRARRAGRGPAAAAGWSARRRLGSNGASPGREKQIRVCTALCRRAGAVSQRWPGSAMGRAPGVWARAWVRGGVAGSRRTALANHRGRRLGDARAGRAGRCAGLALGSGGEAARSGRGRGRKGVRCGFVLVRSVQLRPRFVVGRDAAATAAERRGGGKRAGIRCSLALGRTDWRSCGRDRRKGGARRFSSGSGSGSWALRLAAGATVMVGRAGGMAPATLR